MKQRVFRLSSRASRDVLRTPSARRQRRSLRSGYAFAHQVRSQNPISFISLNNSSIFNNHRKALVALSRLAKLCENYRKILHSH